MYCTDYNITTKRLHGENSLELDQHSPETSLDIPRNKYQRIKNGKFKISHEYSIKHVKT